MGNYIYRSSSVKPDEPSKELHKDEEPVTSGSSSLQEQIMKIKSLELLEVEPATFTNVTVSNLSESISVLTIPDSIQLKEPVEIKSNKRKFTFDTTDIHPVKIACIKSITPKNSPNHSPNEENRTSCSLWTVKDDKEDIESNKSIYKMMKDLML